MTTAELIFDRVRALPADQQAVVLRLVEAMRPAAPARSPLFGACPGLRIDSADIDAARRELWSDFPRKDLP